jgi:hypothetical protein
VHEPAKTTSVSYGSAKYQIGAGTTKTIKIPLSATARKAIKKSKSHCLAASVVFGTTALKVTLRR